MGELLKNNGMIPFLMKAGKDIVSAIMTKEEMDKIIKNGEVVENNDHVGYNVLVNDLFYFSVADEKVKKVETIENHLIVDDLIPEERSCQESEETPSTPKRKGRKNA